MIKEEFEMDDIFNYYGGLSIASDEDKKYWAILNYDGHYWVEIPDYLYDALVKFKNEKVAESN